MSEASSGTEPADRSALQVAPGTERPRRFRPQLRYELIGCGLHGHELLGTDAAHLRPEDRIFAWDDSSGTRWYRCLRCDAWLPLPPPGQSEVEHPPDREDVELPLRGRPLRDRYVLRVIAADRALHVLVLGALTVAVFAFAAHRSLLHHDYTRILAALQGAFGGPVARSGFVADINKLFKLSTSELYAAGAAAAVYTILLACEMVGLWFARRWAEYLTFVETGILVPYEIYELSKSISWLKILTLVINLLVVLYLLIAHRLFGVRGGGTAEGALHERDTGWAPLERATPPGLLGAGPAAPDRRTPATSE
ncbi:MAG TPA: DUF2127 domain-containing protein [Acidimicrobiales bacterium]|nr:DUF2127 domain-containing protein [Acidimicrobiales bacterium]